MARRKTTIYVDEELLRAAKVHAARNDLRDSDVIESAPRKFLGLELLDAIWDRTADSDPPTADRIAYAELAAARAARRLSDPQPVEQ